MGIFYREKAFHAGTKIRKNDFAPLKNIPLTSLVGTLVMCDMRWTLRIGLRARRNAPRNSAIAHQRGNHSSGKLSRQLLGTLTSH